MSKLLKYELKRLLWNKFYICLFLITLFYGWNILTTDIILGVSNTAPFSAWSFGYYLAQVLPVLSIIIIFFITFLYSKQEKKVQKILTAVPFPYQNLVFIRFLAMGIGILLPCMGVIFTACFFYQRFFQYTEIRKLIPIVFLVLLPTFLFLIGIGLWIGNKQPSALYGIMIVLLGCSFFILPHFIEPFGKNFFVDYPFQLGGIEPAFTLSKWYIGNRILYSLVGGILFIFGIKGIGIKKKEA